MPTHSGGVVAVLEKLPSTFTKEFSYGLGFAQPYRFIVDAVEELSDCSGIIISDSHKTGIEPATPELFYISKTDLERARVELNRIERHAQSASRAVRAVAAYNIFAERLDVPKLYPKTGRDPYRKLFTMAAQGKEELSDADQSLVISALRDNAASIAKNQPEKLAKLRGDIELLTLDALIKRYQEMLATQLDEGQWQEFFNENPFILNMAFGYPIIKVQDQASVGGRKLSGDGGKIADFLVKNTLTNNMAIFEIKTPQTPVLSKREFRGGVFTPSSDISGSINQILDQKYQFDKQITQIKDSSRTHDIESYAVHCCLVIGMMPSSDDQKKSFELFRKNSKNVEIVTFDELFEKIRYLSVFLQDTSKNSPKSDVADV